MSNKDMSILVVENFPTMRRIIMNILNQLGYTNLIEAEDGQQAFGVLEKDTVDLVVSDWDMPNMTGIELLRKVRTNARLRNLPFLMVTSQSQKESILEAARAGVNEYVVKPFTVGTIRGKIDKIFTS